MITISSLPANVVALNKARPAWVEHITSTFRDSIESTILVGMLLLEAKASLPHGEFEAMVEDDLPFVPRTGRMFMAIAADLRLRSHGSVLPPSWRTLYELTKLTDDDFEAKIADGTINPKMERKAVAPPKAKALVPGKNVVPINPPRQARGREAITARVKDAIVALSGLPRAAEVVGYFDGTDQAIIVGERLSDAAQWLSDFAVLWPKGDNSAEAAE